MSRVDEILDKYAKSIIGIHGAILYEGDVSKEQSKR